MKWASTRPQTKKVEPVIVAAPKDPNLCFIVFPALQTASSVAVSLESLLRQVQKQPDSSVIEVISYDAGERRLAIHFQNK